LLFDKDVMDSEVTNFLPLLVSIVFTSTLFLTNNLMRSKALYAEIPPPITNKIFLFRIVIGTIKILIKQQLQYLKN
jgi:hypothetical protein